MSYQVRVVVTNGESTYDLIWVKVRPEEVQCGISARTYRYHASFHKSGEIRISKEPGTLSPGDEPPAIAQVDSGNWKREPLQQLRGKKRVGAFALSIDDDSLRDYPLFKKSREHDSVVYVDTRCLREKAVGIEVWVAPPSFFYQRMPNPPGFRYILELPQLWLVLNVTAGEERDELG